MGKNNDYHEKIVTSTYKSVALKNISFIFSLHQMQFFGVTHSSRFRDGAKKSSGGGELKLPKLQNYLSAIHFKVPF